VISKNPSAVPADTSPEIWKMQMKAVGEMTVEQRVAIWEDTQEEFAIMEAAAMRRSHPSFNDYEILVELVRARYGDELAGKIVAKSDAISA